MIDAQEAMVPVMMAEIRDILFASVGQHTLKAEGGSFVMTQGTKYSSADIPHIANMRVQAREIAGALEDGLTH
jgi:hypothetical protein